MVTVWVFLAVLVSLLIIPVTGVAFARDKLIAEMGRSAQSVRGELEGHVVYGRSLVKGFAADSRLQNGDNEQRSVVLANQIG